MAQNPPLHHTVRLLDIDGTVIKKREGGWFQEPAEALPGALELVEEWFQRGDYIIFWTAI